MKQIFRYYWMVFAGTGVALVLVTGGVTVAVMALQGKEPDTAKVTPSLHRLPVVPSSRPGLSEPNPFAPTARPLAVVPDTVGRRAIPIIAKNAPAATQPEDLDRFEDLVIDQPQPKGLKDLLAHLDHKYPKVRLNAIVGLGKMGAAARDAVPAIAKALGDLDKDIVNAAGKALARIGPAAVPVLIQELKNPASRQHILAARSLALIGPDAADAVPVLIDCLKQKDIELRTTAAHALGEIGPASWKASATLTLLVGDPGKEGDKKARAAQAELLKQSRAALAQIGPQAIPALRGALKSPNASIRRQAADLIALHGNKAKDAVGDLIDLLKDKQPAARRSAALALAAIGREAAEATDPLIACAADTDPKVRAEVARALGEIRADGQALTTLVNLFGDPVPGVRLQAARAVVKIGPSAINILMNTIPNENFHRRLSAIFALGEIGSKASDAVPLLIEQLQDQLPMIRSQSALALGKIGPKAAKKAVEPLKDRLQEEKEGSVRLGMLLSLVQLQPDDNEAPQLLAKEVHAFVIGTNLDLFKKAVLSATRPRTPLEIQRQGQIQGVLNFYVFRNSFRFGDGLDKWSHNLLKSLGVEAIPAMVNTLNKENFIGGKEGYIANGRWVDWQPDAGRNSVFFH